MLVATRSRFATRSGLNGPLSTYVMSPPRISKWLIFSGYIASSASCHPRSFTGVGSVISFRACGRLR